MAKDPAFLFYSQDWLVGTNTMNFEDRGKYITILCQMHQEGRLTEETISFLVGSISVKLRSKFSVDENGLWYNQRLEDEAHKRANFTKSRRDNGSKGGRPTKDKPNDKPKNNHMDNLSGDHMGNENENEDLDNNLDIIPKFSFFDSLISLGVEEQVLKDWIKVRKDKKASNTETALKAFLKKIEGSGKTVNEAIKICAENSWKGFDKDWLKSIQPTQTTNVYKPNTNYHQ